MTLDEAIKKEEELAIQQIEKANALDNIPLFGMSKDDIEEIKECYKCSKEHEQLAEWLKELKQLRNQTRWIPVSERLPELNRPLLVTAYHRIYYGHLISESGNYGYPIFRIHGLGDKNRDWVQETMSHEPYSLGRIDAWMYFDIPEPYKASPTGAERTDKE